MFASCSGVRTALSVPSGPSEAPQLLRASNGIVVVLSCSVRLTEKDEPRGSLFNLLSGFVMLQLKRLLNR